MEFVIVTGLSGSGKSCAVNVLEDIGFYCVDNMPPQLIGKFADICDQSGGKIKRVALVTDIRGGDLFFQLPRHLDTLRQQGFQVKLLFLDASDEALIKRYKETRRKHPLDDMSYGNVQQAVARERELLLPLREQADYTIDTTYLSTSQLKEQVYSLFLDNPGDSMIVKVMSFGFKYGALGEADLIFDVRCLPNPFYVPELRPCTGRDPSVSNYVMQYPQSRELLKKLEDLIDFLLPLYISEGKSQLVVGFGCTGGKHRSVTFAEELYRYLEQKNIKARIVHRDISKGI